jgi:hypothetical protein
MVRGRSPLRRPITGPSVRPLPQPGLLRRPCHGVFAKHGVQTLLVSKFGLGLDAVSARLSGTSGVSFHDISVVYDAVGATF